MPGDVVIAERGFTCDDYARMAYAEAKIPPFTKGKKLEQFQVNLTQELSIVCIHVKQVIEVIKQKYTILQSVLPISFIRHKDDIGNATVDKL